MWANVNGMRWMAAEVLPASMENSLEFEFRDPFVGVPLGWQGDALVEISFQFLRGFGGDCDGVAHGFVPGWVDQAGRMAGDGL
jgi:hypothetical protein